jgi:hypothetical protein
MTMPRKIFVIMTYHIPPERDEAAEAWKEENVAAVGWSSVGDLAKVKSFEKLSEKFRSSGSRGPSTLWTFLKEIKKGDLILAYVTRNTIAYVGEVIGPYKYDKKNKVGMNPSHGGFGFAHQRRVNWWPKPHYFSRKKLPMEIAEQIGIKGCIIKEVNPGSLGFDGFSDFLRSSADSLTDSGLDINEDTIKAGIRKYLRNYLGELEKGLSIISAERSILDQERPDFKARDAKGNLVLIECKGVADEDAAWQAKKYLSRFKREKGTRSIIVAFKITPKCKLIAEKHGLEAFECNLTFHKI